MLGYFAMLGLLSIGCLGSPILLPKRLSRAREGGLGFLGHLGDFVLTARGGTWSARHRCRIGGIGLGDGVERGGIGVVEFVRDRPDVIGVGVGGRKTHRVLATTATAVTLG